MDSFVQDVRCALRWMRRSPSFALAAVAVLGVGLGAVTVVFSVINGILLKPGPGERPDRLVRVFSNRFSGSAWLDYADYRDRNSTLPGLAAYGQIASSLRVESAPEHVFVELATANYFDVLGVRPALGRAFLPEDEAEGNPAPGIVLEDAFWRSRFGADPSVVGRTVFLDGLPVVVAGVAPPGFVGGLAFFRPALWAPLALRPALRPGTTMRTSRAEMGLDIIGRLRDGVPIEQARADLEAINAALAKAYPETNADRSVAISPYRALPPEILPPAVAAAAFLLAGAGLVLVTACTNVGTMLLARAVARRREIGVRLALGAGWLRILRQLLTESLVIALAGGAAGLVVAVWARALLLRALPAVPLPIALELPIDGRVVLFGLAVSAAAAVLFGLAPALHACRRDVVPVLRGGHGAVARGGLAGSRLRAGFTVAQVALSLVLLAAAGLFVRAAARARAVDLGMRIDHVLTAGLELGGRGYDPDSRRAFERALVERLEAIPGVVSANAATILPLTLSNRGQILEVEGGPPPSRDAAMRDAGVNVNVTGPGHFRTLGIPLRAGRDFDRRDVPGASLVAVVNATLARRYWPGADPVGRRIRFWGEPPGPWMEVIGVVEDSKYVTVGEDPRSFVFLPLAQEDAGMIALLVRTEGDPMASLPAVREAVRALDPDLVVFDAKPMEEAAAISLFPVRFAGSFLGALGAIGLLLAASGLYGVMSFVVRQRTTEIGVRMALGARPAQILTLVLGQGMRWTGVGIGIGLALALALARLVAGMLYGVSPADPAAFVTVGLVLSAVAAAACLAPARRAARVDPVEALRSE